MKITSMKSNLVFACLLIGLQHPSEATAQAVLTISPKAVDVVGVQAPRITINTAASDSLRKRSFRYGPPLSWYENHQEPLYVIDGKIADSETLKSISPQDIENIDVIKGVRAVTFYGHLGAGGAIIITTRKPRINQSKEKGRLD
ncbi:TonB-dependent receptor plug domain-containing protein [Hymenobacter sp. B1770]|uniref:TonB-dependent receptor plug domain-containing protein n=1 Tax=Hymenobacter sp. B1770 TaxID=1718788 RepID=UPI003CF9CAD7